MKKIFVMSLLFTITLLLAARIDTFPVHGQLTGTVCVVSSTSATSCPSAPPSFFDSSSRNLTVALFISGSNAMGGAKVSVVTNPMILNPTAISFVGTVVPAPIVLVDCINGVPVAGSGGSCQAGIDGSGVASLGILSLGRNTIAPTTGLLFTVTFNVLSTTQTGIDVLVNSGCAGNSITGTNDCILITAGAFVDPEKALVGALVNGVTDPNALATTSAAPAGTTATSVNCSPS
ncbi:MAG TPA: hypothetical protein VNA15_03195, partial [Candidatus Angelobacter sp.]|nr:hypothetical protein [Candidatus Angelobacter sp.]